MSGPDPGRRAIMFVHAHPDDETTTTGATIARYAATGAAVTLVTCTRGEQGDFVDPEAAGDVLAAVGGRAGPRVGPAAERFGHLRALELVRACRSLGIGPPTFLGGPGRWQDSGMAGAPPRDGTFATADRHEAVRALVAQVRAHRPHVLVTYDRDGGYGHPDHIQAHRITMAAFDAAADPLAYPGSGPPWAVARVFAAVVAHSALQSAAAYLARAAVPGSHPFSAVATAGRHLPFGVPDEEVDVRVDASSFLPAKIAAMRAHRSQMPPDGWFFALATRSDSGMGHEHYRLLAQRGAGVRDPADAPAADLFDGLRDKPIPTQPRADPPTRGRTGIPAPSS